MDTKDELAHFRAIAQKISEAQEVWHDGRKLRRADLRDVLAHIKALEAKVAREDAARAGHRGLMVMYPSFNPELRR